MNELKVGQWYREKGTNKVYVLSFLCVKQDLHRGKEYREVYALVSPEGGYWSFGEADTLVSAFGKNFEDFELIDKPVLVWV